jgi:hypothetical protein
MRRLLQARATRVVLLGLVAISSVPAWGYFSSVGAGSTSAGVTQLAAPTISSATPGAGTVALTWSTVTPPGTGAVKYYVKRDGGAPGGDCPSSSSPSTATSCTDSGVSIGTHSYTVTAVWRSWASTSSAASAQVTIPGPATHLVLAAASTTPTAGVADNLTITAQDAGNNTATSYTGSHNLTFGGAANSPDSTRPTVSSSSGTAINFGTATAISFSSGVASVSGSNNGVMKLYKAETASITVSDGTISNGSGLSVTVSPASAARLAWTSVTVSAGTLSSPCLFTCTATGLGNSGTFKANVSVTDSAGNTVVGLGSGHTVLVTSSPASGGTITGGSLTIAATGAANSTTQFTFTGRPSGSYTVTITAATASGTAYTNATATATR